MKFEFILSLGRTAFQDAMVVAGTHLGYMERKGKKFRGISDRLQIYLDRLSYQNTPLLLPSGSGVREEMIKHYGVAEEKIKILFPPIDVMRFHAELKKQKAAWRKQFGMPADKKIFVFVSSNHALKGL